MLLKFLLSLLLLNTAIAPSGEVLGVKTNTEDFPRRISQDTLGISTTAKSAIVVDSKTGKVLFEKNADEALPIASITKLISVYTFFKTKTDWEKKIKITSSDLAAGGNHKNIFLGDEIRIKDLVYTSLIGSDNDAIKTLARSTGLKELEFVNQMNEVARKEGLKNTHFIEVTGLSPKNVSTAREITRIAHKIFQEPTIKDATERTEYIFKPLNKKRARRVSATNKLLGNKLFKIISGKTGYTRDAGYSLTIEAENKDGNRVIVVVLGSRGEKERFKEAKALAFWAFENYTWK